MEQSLHEELSCIKSMLARVETKIDALSSLPKRVRVLEQFRSSVMVVGAVCIAAISSVAAYFRM